MKDVNLATCDVCQRVYGKLGQQHAGLHPNVWREDVCTQAIMFAGGNTFPDGGTHILGNVFRGEHIYSEMCSGGNTFPVTPGCMILYNISCISEDNQNRQKITC